MPFVKVTVNSLPSAIRPVMLYEPLREAVVVLVVVCVAPDTVTVVDPGVYGGDVMVPYSVNTYTGRNENEM